MAVFLTAGYEYFTLWHLARTARACELQRRESAPGKQHGAL